MGMNRMFRTVVASAMVLLAACSGGGGTTSSSVTTSTVQAKGTVNSGEIGGANLTVLSAQQETTAPVQGSSYTTTISTSGPQLLFVQDANDVVRGLTFTLNPSASSHGTPTIVPADATSTALGLLLLSPGVTPSDWSLAQPVVTALQSLNSFPAFVAFLQANLPTKALPEIVADPAYGTLLSACLAEWPTKAATVAPLSSPGTSAVAFAVAPKVSPTVAPPALETGGITVTVDGGYTGKNDISATLRNYSLRSVALYELHDSTGTGSPLTRTGPSEWIRGGEAPNSLTLFGVQPKGIVPKTISKSLTFLNSNEKVHYYAVGPGFAPSSIALPPEVIVGFNDLWLPVGYDLSKYVVAPALSFVFGLPISDIFDTVVTTLDGLNDPDPALLDLKKQLVRVSTEQILSAESVLAYRVLLKEYSKVALGKAAPLIKGGTRGFLSAVSRIGSLFDAANLIYYAGDLIQLPRYAQVEVASPYDTIQFSTATYIAKKTDQQAVISLTRTDGSNDVMEVQYTITPGTALDGQDYMDASQSPGIIRFEAGQRAASISVRLINNPANTGARFATLSLGKIITGLGKVGPQSALSLTIGSWAPLNVCEADVPTYAPSGCEWPRIVARNPYTPLQAGRSVSISDLLVYRPGTCNPITKMTMMLPFSGTNWNLLGIPDGYRGQYAWAAFSYLPTSQSAHLDLSSIALEPSIPASSTINISSIWTVYSGDDPYVPALKSGYINCTFRQETSGGGP